MSVQEAMAFWVRAPGEGDVRPVVLPEPGPGDVVVRTRFSGISRGSEGIVFRGEVPPARYTDLRAPFQDGEFPAPVKYGYLNVGVVEQGPDDLVDRTVFCLYPHQTRYVVPAAAVVPVPPDVPAERAVLAGTVETAVNALWDAGPLVGDRVVVVGAGMVGCCVARLLAGIPGVRVVLADVDRSRRETAQALGAEFAVPDEVRGRFDLAFHTSATAAGLQVCLDLLADEGSVIDLSWYGDRTVHLELGSAFHVRRLAIRSSQVGRVAPSRRTNRTTADRLAIALELLRDDAFDTLLSGCSPFADLPHVMARLAAGEPSLCHTIHYD